MQANRKLAFAVLAGIAIGVAGARAMRAGQAKTPPGYMIAEVDVTDPATYEKYRTKVQETVAAFKGQFIVRAGKTISLEGEPPKRVVVIAFDSVEQAKAWYDSPAYDAIKSIRHSSAKTRQFIVEGVAPK